MTEPITEQPEEQLRPDEAPYVANVRLILAPKGLIVMPGDVVILGDADREAGVNTDSLLKLGAIAPYVSQEQADKAGGEGLAHIAEKRQRRDNERRGRGR
tara:strand:- start:352 stop:651 length:300 start_codon:yes stop_codon:yes gene_type:complete